MRIAWRLAAVVFISACALGESNAPASVPAPVACSKTITFAIAEGGQPVPAIPKFAAKWIGKAKHVEGYPDMCLAQIPSSKTANYVVVFSTKEASFDGLAPTAHTYTSTAPMSGSLAGGSSYGGTWNYSYVGMPPVPTTGTLDLQRVDESKKVLVVRAYNQQGRQVSHQNVDGDHNRESVLQQVMADIHREIVEKPEQKRMAAPLSVYYVNCDVDSPGPALQMAANDPPPVHADSKPVPLPPPLPTVEFWSNPAGADIFLDGEYLGRTPFTSAVHPGEHSVVIRKTEYGAWQRKIQVATGARKVTAYLERKFLTLPSSQPQDTAAK
jgi:hypothetical protein